MIRINEIERVRFSEMIDQYTEEASMEHAAECPSLQISSL